MAEWIRPTERPDWGRDDCEWWLTPHDSLRLPTDDEIGRFCSVGRCGSKAWLVREERVTRWRHAPYTRRSFRCEQHVYANPVIEDVRVLVARPRFDMAVEGA